MKTCDTCIWNRDGKCYLNPPAVTVVMVPDGYGGLTPDWYTERPYVSGDLGCSHHTTEEEILT